MEPTTIREKTMTTKTYAILTDITPNRATVALIGSMEDVYDEAEKIGGQMMIVHAEGLTLGERVWTESVSVVADPSACI